MGLGLGLGSGFGLGFEFGFGFGWSLASMPWPRFMMWPVGPASRMTSFVRSSMSLWLPGQGSGGGVGVGRGFGQAALAEEDR